MHRRHNYMRLKWVSRGIINGEIEKAAGSPSQLEEVRGGNGSRN